MRRPVGIGLVGAPGRVRLVDGGGVGRCARVAGGCCGGGAVLIGLADDGGWRRRFVEVRRRVVDVLDRLPALLLADRVGILRLRLERNVARGRDLVAQWPAASHGRVARTSVPDPLLQLGAVHATRSRLQARWQRRAALRAVGGGRSRLLAGRAANLARLWGRHVGALCTGRSAGANGRRVALHRMAGRCSPARFPVPPDQRGRHQRLRQDDVRQALAARLGVLCVELDALHWEADWTEAPDM